MQELISIVIPFYNDHDHIAQTIQSIANQTYPNLEVIITDDGSTPSLSEAAIVDMLKGRDEQHQLNTNVQFQYQKNAGAPTARNNGRSLTTGEYLIFWDADIMAKPEFIQKMHNVLTLHPEVDYAYCSYKLGNKEMTGKKFSIDTLKQQNYIPTTSLIRTEKALLWDESLKRFQDWDLWLRMAKEGSIGIFVPEVLFIAAPESGISNWLPSFAYKSPWRYLPQFKKKVEAYERAKAIIQKKHNI